MCMKKLLSLPVWNFLAAYVALAAALTALVASEAHEALVIPADSRVVVIARDEIFWTPLQLQLALEHLAEESALFTQGQADRAGLQERLEQVRSKAGILKGTQGSTSSVSSTSEYQDVMAQLPVFLEHARERVNTPTPASLRELRDEIAELGGNLTSLAVTARAASLAAQTARETALERGRSTMFAGFMAGWLVLCGLGLHALLFWRRSTIRLDERDAELTSLRRALDMARQTEAVRNTFLGKVSHEINSPLQTILTNVQLMEGRLDERDSLAKIVPRLKASVNHLRGQVHDLLDVAEINSGKMRVKFGEVDVAALVVDAVNVQQTAAENKGLHLTLQTAGLGFIRSDGRRINQILTNLITNAIRYTEAGSIRVLAELESRQQDQFVLHLTVKDSGIGFAPEVLENLYQPFMPVVKHRAGSGLGLAIVKGLVDQLNGTIDLKTELGVGSEFNIRIPVTVLQTAPATQEQAPRHAVAESRIPQRPARARFPADGANANHLLFVEDDPEIQDTMSELLELLGYVCHTASSMQEGLSFLTERKYSAIVVDMELGDGTGLDVARAAKSTVNRNVPLVVCTAYSDLLDQPGMDIFDARFRKPVDAQALRDMLTKLVSEQAVIEPGLC